MKAALLAELQKLIQESKIIPDHHKQEWLNGLTTLNDAKGKELKEMIEKEPPLEKELKEEKDEAILEEHKSYLKGLSDFNKNELRTIFKEAEKKVDKKDEEECEKLLKKLDNV